MNEPKKLSEILSEMKEAQERFIYLDKNVYLSDYNIMGLEMSVTLFDVDEEKNIEQTMLTSDFSKFHSKLLKPMKVEKINVPKNMGQIRKMLLANIQKLANGEIEIERAREMANHAQTIVNITKLELQYYREFKNGELDKFKIIG